MRKTFEVKTQLLHPAPSNMGLEDLRIFFFDAKMTNNAFFKNKKRASSTSVSALNGPDIKMY